MTPINSAAQLGALGTKIALKLLRGPQRVREWLEEMEKRRSCIVGDDVILYPLCRISNLGVRDAIRIGDCSRILGQLYVLAHGGRISIGKPCFLGEHSRIWSSSSVTIGNRVLVSHNVNIQDNNAHPLSAEERHRHVRQIFTAGHPKQLENVPSSPITIEDDVWISFNCTILKGVTIGKGAVIGAGTIITKDVEPYTVVAGSPPSVVGKSYQ